MKPAGFKKKRAMLTKIASRNMSSLLLFEINSTIGLNFFASKIEKKSFNFILPKFV